jgi:large subunit ribosomal protein L36
LFVVCTKSPKHKQRQGVHTHTSCGCGGEAPATTVSNGAPTFASSGIEGEFGGAAAKTCCEEFRMGGAEAFDARGLTLTGNYANRRASSLLPNIARF